MRAFRDRDYCVRLGSADFIRQKHPELKGSARSAEWGKCKADPAGYMKTNS